MKACENCGLPVAKEKNRFCGRSCRNAWQHANGIRRDYVNDVSRKGKTFEDQYGVEKARAYKEKLSKAAKGKTYEERYGVEKAAELRKVRSERFTGEKHPFHGKSHTDDAKRKISEGNQGEKNGMYGVDSPVSATWGIQGKYHDVLFRSTYELAYLVQAKQEGWFDNLTCEPLRIKLTLMIDGRQKRKTYSPDYYRSDTNELIEIKPKWKLTHNYRNCLEKHEAAISFCNEQGMKFRLLTEDDLINLSQRMSFLTLPGVVLFRNDIIK